MYCTFSWSPPYSYSMWNKTLLSWTTPCSLWMFYCPDKNNEAVTKTSGQILPTWIASFKQLSMKLMQQFGNVSDRQDNVIVQLKLLKYWVEINMKMFMNKTVRLNWPCPPQLLLNFPLYQCPFCVSTLQCLHAGWSCLTTSNSIPRGVITALYTV